MDVDHTNRGYLYADEHVTIYAVTVGNSQVDWTCPGCCHCIQGGDADSCSSDKESLSSTGSSSCSSSGDEGSPTSNRPTSSRTQSSDVEPNTSSDDKQSSSGSPRCQQNKRARLATASLSTQGQNPVYSRRGSSDFKLVDDVVATASRRSVGDASDILGFVVYARNSKAPILILECESASSVAALERHPRLQPFVTSAYRTGCQCHGQVNIPL